MAELRAKNRNRLSPVNAQTASPIEAIFLSNVRLGRISQSPKYECCRPSNKNLTPKRAFFNRLFLHKVLFYTQEVALQSGNGATNGLHQSTRLAEISQSRKFDRNPFGGKITMTILKLNFGPALLQCTLQAGVTRQF
jgi:hypothetical protein